eukprot:6063350-Lingulodinium_polyedra.AAC.1
MAPGAPGSTPRWQTQSLGRCLCHLPLASSPSTRSTSWAGAALASASGGCSVASSSSCVAFPLPPAWAGSWPMPGAGGVAGPPSTCHPIGPSGSPSTGPDARWSGAGACWSTLPPPQAS